MSTVSAHTETAPGPRLTSDLIFDVGMHRGEDTLYYLRKGFRVVAFEAHPELAQAGRERFADELRDGRFQIVSGAIVAGDEETVTFYAHSKLSTWGTVAPTRADRNQVMGDSIEITVPAVNFGRCLSDYGVPHYLKIDIEASDLLCLDALLEVEPDQRPSYVSVEAESETWAGVVRQFDVLERLGYSRFAIVQQALIGNRPGQIRTIDGDTVPYTFEMYSSGPFGDDLRSRWMSKGDAMRHYRPLLVALRAGSAFDRLMPKGPEIRWVTGAIIHRPLPGWFDIHAAR